jgi:hypothetical protein
VPDEQLPEIAVPDVPGVLDDATMLDDETMAALTRAVLRERTAALIAEACAWAVGLSDQRHHLRRRGRLAETGGTVGERAASGLPLSGEEDGRIELGDARPGSFQDALNAVGPDGQVYADRFDRELLEPFVHETCVQAAGRARAARPAAWAELADELGEDAADLAGVVRAGGYEDPLRIDAEHLVLAALGAVPLVEVEAEGLPLSLVRSAEAVARAAVPPRSSRPADGAGDGAGHDDGQQAGDDGDLAGALFLAEAALGTAGLARPVPPEQAGRLVDALLAEGLEPDEVAAVLPHLPVQPDTAVQVTAVLATLPGE